MRKDADVAPQRLRRKKYFNVPYLVVDEVGFEPMSHQDANQYYQWRDRILNSAGRVFEGKASPTAWGCMEKFTQR
jgi:hypothetical protein